MKLGQKLSPLFIFPFPPGSIWPWDRVSCPQPTGTRPCLGRTHSCPFPSLPLSPQCVSHHSCKTGDSAAHLPVPSFRSLRLSYQDNRTGGRTARVWSSAGVTPLHIPTANGLPNSSWTEVCDTRENQLGSNTRPFLHTPGTGALWHSNTAIVWKVLGAKFKLNRSELYPALEVLQRPGWAAMSALSKLLRIFQRLSG